MKRQKARKTKELLLGALLMTGIACSPAAFAGEKEKPSLEGNQLKNRTEYKSMLKTMERIEKDQARIEFYKAELKANKEAGKVIPAHMSKKELKKAKADLKRDKKHLKIDKRDLKKDQRYAIFKAENRAFYAKCDLRAAKRKLRRDLRKGNIDQLDADLAEVKRLEKEVNKKEEIASNLEEDVDEFFAYLEDEIDETLS